MPDSFWQDYKNKVDVIIAGPPCQGFSMSGQRDKNDKRNTLFEEIIRATRILEPKFTINWKCCRSTFYGEFRGKRYKKTN